MAMWDRCRPRDVYDAVDLFIMRDAIPHADLKEPDLRTQLGQDWEHMLALQLG